MKKCVTWGEFGVFSSRCSGFLFLSFGYFLFLSFGYFHSSRWVGVFTPHQIGFSLPIRSGFHPSSIAVVTPPKANPSSHLLLNAFSQTHPNEDTSQRTESMLHSSTHSIKQSASSNEIAKTISRITSFRGYPPQTAPAFHPSLFPQLVRGRKDSPRTQWIQEDRPVPID